MNKMLTSIFDSETAAFEGLSALKDLHRDGDITVYSSAVIVKDKSGKIEVKQAADAGPAGAALGLLTGSLIGLLGGPAGMAVGASLGGLTGLLYDVSKSGVDIAFVDEISKTLTAGKSAVLADVEESWTTPVDTRLHKLGGMVFRRLRAEIVEDQFVRESAALEANLKALQDDLREGVAENRVAMQKEIDLIKKQLESTEEQVKARIDQARSETNAKVKALHDQAKGASERAKTRIEKRIADVKAEFEARSNKLSQAWTLTKEALAA